MTKSVKPVTEKFLICLKKNPLDSNRLSPWFTKRANTPRDYWQIVFPELPHQKWYWYLLLLFIGHPFQVARIFPLLHQQGQESQQATPQRDHTRFGVPIGMPSDRGPHFISEVLQQLSKQLGINWDLHTPWRLQSSRRVEWMNHILKSQISKMCQETFLKRLQVLPPVRVQPQPNFNELMFGESYSAATFPASEKLIRTWEIEQCLILLGNLLNELKRFVILSEPLT